MDFNLIGQGGKALGQYIGYLSCDSLVMPFNFDDWRDVPVDVKQEVKNLLELCQSYNKIIINVHDVTTLFWIFLTQWVLLSVLLKYV